MRFFSKVVLAALLAAATSASVLAQYGGRGSGTGSMGTGGYTPPKGGYSAGTGIAIGAGAAAGAGLAYFALRNRGTVVGCVEQSSEGNKLLNEKDKNTYALLGNGDLALSPGERVALKGKKTKDDSGKLNFRVEKLAKDYGPCQR